MELLACERMKRVPYIIYKNLLKMDQTQMEELKLQNP